MHERDCHRSLPTADAHRLTDVVRFVLEETVTRGCDSAEWV